jgi:hypothetical protein
MPDIKHTLRWLIEDFKDTLEQEKKEILSSDYPDDLLHEYADSAVPVYNWDLAQLLANNQELAFPDEPTLVADSGDDFNIFKIIMFSVYERLLEAGHEWFNEQKAEVG